MRCALPCVISIHDARQEKFSIGQSEFTSPRRSAVSSCLHIQHKRVLYVKDLYVRRASPKPLTAGCIVAILLRRRDNNVTTLGGADVSRRA